MTRQKYIELYYHIFGTTHLRGEFWVKHRDMLMTLADAGGCAQYFITTEGQIYMKQHEETKASYSLDNIAPANWLGNCEAATPAWPPRGLSPCMVTQEKGNNPMRINNTTATAYVTSEKSDSALSRDYLLRRLAEFESWRNPKLPQLRKLFNMDAPSTPTTSQALIEAIKNDKFKMDQKKLDRLADELEQGPFDTVEEYMEEYGYGPFYTIIFTDLPKADEKGYVTALNDFAKALTATKDVIMVKSPEDGLTALQALEAWVPVGKAN